MMWRCSTLIPSVHLKLLTSFTSQRFHSNSTWSMKSNTCCCYDETICPASLKDISWWWTWWMERAAVRSSAFTFQGIGAVFCRWRRRMKSLMEEAAGLMFSDQTRRCFNKTHGLELLRVEEHFCYHQISEYSWNIRMQTNTSGTSCHRVCSFLFRGHFKSHKHHRVPVFDSINLIYSHMKSMRHINTHTHFYKHAHTCFHMQFNKHLLVHLMVFEVFLRSNPPPHYFNHHTFGWSCDLPPLQAFKSPVWHLGEREGEWTATGE